MLKVLQKIFGCWRTIEVAADHRIIRSFMHLQKAKSLYVLSNLKQAHRHSRFATPTDWMIALKLLIYNYSTC